MKNTNKALEQIVRKLAELPDEQDVPLSWTRRQLDTLQERKRELEAQIRTIRDATPRLAKLEAEIVPEIEWLGHLATWRERLCEELEALPPAQTSQEQGVRQNLLVSVACIDRGIGVVDKTGWGLETLRLGQLMRDSGFVAGPPAPGQLFGRLPWRGCTAEVEERIADLTKQRDETQAQLEYALLDDDARAKRDAESAARRDAFNNLTADERRAAHNIACGYTADGLPRL